MVICYKKKSIVYTTDELTVYDRYMEEVYLHDVKVTDGEERINRVMKYWIFTKKFKVFFKNPHNYKVGDKVRLI